MDTYWNCMTYKSLYDAPGVNICITNHCDIFNYNGHSKIVLVFVQEIGEIVK